MSPSRYSFSAVLVHHIDGPDTAEIRFQKEKDGLFVKWEDYARLKAENERLTKAGDKMADTLEKDEQRYNGCPSTEAYMWYVAKEGGCP